jgi:hypothetical protein
MKWAALVTWVATAGGGFVLLGVWLKHRGLEQRNRPGRMIRPPLIFSHFALAAAGLVVWIVYLAVHKKAVAWIGFGLLVPVALLGFAMLALWLQRRQLTRQSAGAATAPPQPLGSPAVGASPEAAEQRFPVPIVVGHGLLAVATVVLALLTAAGVGS